MTPQRAEPSPGLPTDTLADSVLILLVLMGVQRVAGLLRAVLFCRWLDPEQLGQWEMAFGFLMLAGPVAVFSLPGTFGRYVEHFRRQGQLPSFLKHTAFVCLGLATTAALALVAARQWFASLVFGSVGHSGLVMILAGALLTVVAFNFLAELLTALRAVRLVARLQLLNSIAFAALGAALVLDWAATAASVTLAYAGACLLSVFVATGHLRRAWPHLASNGPPLSHLALWSKLLPLAFWIWCGNVLTNLFDLIDRYLIVHCLPVSHQAALAAVGQYHSSRVIALLLFSVATLLGAMALPHWSADWEAGRREQVSTRIRLFVKVLTLALVAGAVALLLVTPVLFRVAFRGKFAEGQAVLPWTFVYCIWFGVAIVVQNYLWCAEKARWGSFALLVGLGTNVLLNLWLLPRWGLHGAVWATTAANALVLVLICLLAVAAGFRMDGGTWALLAVPVVIVLGPWTAAAVLGLVVLDCLVSDRLVSREEKQVLIETWKQYLARWRPASTASCLAEDPTP